MCPPVPPPASTTDRSSPISSPHPSSARPPRVSPRIMPGGRRSRRPCSPVSAARVGTAVAGRRPPRRRRAFRAPGTSGRPAAPSSLRDASERDGSGRRGRGGATRLDPGSVGRSRRAASVRRAAGDRRTVAPAAAAAAPRVAVPSDRADGRAGRARRPAPRGRTTPACRPRPARRPARNRRRR